mgnify:CR=1 FL=1
MTINNKYSIGQMVYLVHDPEQTPMMVLSITVEAPCHYYTLGSGINQTSVHENEISEVENPMFKMGINNYV